jgi:predicted MFS family arabinose efflux permease
VFAGVAYNIMVLALQRLAGELGPAAERAAAFGLLGLGFSLANLGAPVATGLAIDHLGFTATFSVFAMLSLAGFVFVWTDRLPWPPAAAGHAPGSARANAPARTGTLGLLRAPGLARLYACCALFECAWMGFGFMLPIHGTALGLNASRIGLVVGAAGVMLVITRSFMTQLLRRFTPWQLLLLGMALVGWGYIGLASAGNFGQLVASGTLIGLGQGITGPMLNALIYEFAPPDGIGAALGLRTLINNVSQAGMPLLAGAAGASLGFTPVFWALAAGMLAMTWSSRGQWRRGRRGAPRPPRE